jgi:hypothetical protein
MARQQDRDATIAIGIIMIAWAVFAPGLARLKVPAAVFAIVLFSR